MGVRSSHASATIHQDFSHGVLVGRNQRSEGLVQVRQFTDFKSGVWVHLTGCWRLQAQGNCSASQWQGQTTRSYEFWFHACFQRLPTLGEQSCRKSLAWSRRIGTSTSLPPSTLSEGIIWKFASWPPKIKNGSTLRSCSLSTRGAPGWRTKIFRGEASVRFAWLLVFFFLWPQRRGSCFRCT